MGAIEDDLMGAFKDKLAGAIGYVLMCLAEEHIEMARDVRLPEGFNLWWLADRDGWTVAHEAVRFGHLPSGFDQWERADFKGWTVAHEAARGGHLPNGLNLFDLADNDGVTVGDVFSRGVEDEGGVPLPLALGELVTGGPFRPLISGGLSPSLSRRRDADDQD